MSKRILVLGGYGTTGRTLSELLLEFGDAEIVIAGRSLEKGEAAARRLGDRFPGRATARVADAADAASLARAFADVDLVAVAASVLDHAGTVAEAALDAGADYFDLLLSGEEKFAALERLRPRIEAGGEMTFRDSGKATLEKGPFGLTQPSEAAEVADLGRDRQRAQGRDAAQAGELPHRGRVGLGPRDALDLPLQRCTPPSEVLHLGDVVLEGEPLPLAIER